MENKVVDSIEGWLEYKQDEMFLCPYQPGQLRLTLEACAKRHLAAQANSNDLGWLRRGLGYDRVKTGLSVCRQCSIGKQLSRSNFAGQTIPLEDAGMKRIVILQENPQ